MQFDWSFIFSPEVLGAALRGLQTTLLIVLFSAVFSGVIGSAVALMNVSGRQWLTRIGRPYVMFFRNVPLLIQLFFWYFGISIVLPRSQYPFLYQGDYGVYIAIISISLVYGAFTAEVLRSGIEALPSTQMEAALALGLSRRRGFRLIVLPQLWPIVMPGLGNEMITIVKSSALATTVGVTELLWQAQEMEATTFRGFETMTIVTIVFLLLNGTVFTVFRTLERLVRMPYSP